MFWSEYSSENDWIAQLTNYNLDLLRKKWINLSFKNRGKGLKRIHFWSSKEEELYFFLKEKLSFFPKEKEEEDDNYSQQLIMYQISSSFFLFNCKL